MDSILQQLLDLEWWKQGLIAVDSVLFVLYLVSIGYLFCFALFSTGKKHAAYKKSKKQRRIAVLFSAYMEDEMIIESANSIMKQEYPTSNYDVIIVSDKMTEATNEYLASLPLKLMIADYPDNTKVKALQYVMANLDTKSYDIVVVMDAGNITDNDFLEKINNAYNSGCRAIQTHRVAKTRDTDTAVLDAVSEEINNSIFRRGHVRLGFSSALIGSGMVFDFDWFKKHIDKTTDIGLEKQLETMLLEQSIYIEYLDDVFVYDDKAQKTSSYYSQRHRWHVAQANNLKLTISKFPKALFAGNFDFCDKLFQWMLPSRAILFGSLGIIAVGILFVSWILAVKWWGLLFILIFVFSMAIPDYIVDARFVKAIKTIPILFILMVMNTLRRNKI